MQVDAKPIRIGGRFIGQGHPCMVVAEVGINHEGSAERCIDLIEAAARAGADAIKLQTIDPDANYVVGTESHTIFTRGKLTPEETARMFEAARAAGMEAFTTVGDAATLAWLDRLSPSAHKVSSGLLTHTPMIDLLARTGRSLVMSTGMAEQTDIDEAVATARATGNEAFCLLQCTSLYPAPEDALHVRGMGTLVRRYGCPVGFSDHSVGTDAAVVAAAAGAVMIEKHFTLDASRPSFDHRLSLEPRDFRRMVERIRQAETILGSAEKSLSQTEQDSARRYHRCVVAARDVSRGTRLTLQDLAVKRPLPDRRGLPPKALNQLIGMTATRDLSRDDPITRDDVRDLE